MPGTEVHLEFTSGPASTTPLPHPESLVLYFDDPADVAAAVERSGLRPVRSGNPYWDRVGAVALPDPDGFVVVLVPTPWTSAWAGIRRLLDSSVGQSPVRRCAVGRDQFGCR